MSKVIRLVFSVASGMTHTYIVTCMFTDCKCKQGLIHSWSQSSQPYTITHIGIASRCINVMRMTEMGLIEFWQSLTHTRLPTVTQKKIANVNMA